MSKNLLFEDTAVAFALKSDSELERAYFLFKMISNAPLVRVGTAVTNFVLKTPLPVEGLIRATVFDHFCGGTHAQDCLKVVDKIYSQGGVSSVLDYAVEGKEDPDQFDNALKKTLTILEFARDKKAIPFGVFKPSGFGNFDLWEKKSSGILLSATEEAAWKRIERRFDQACHKAKTCDVALLIDAEESWIQEAVDVLVLKMMRKYNTDRAVVYTTIQCYRYDRWEYVKEIHGLAQSQGFHLGIKIVRGAYMEKEIERASAQGYPSPICADKQATDHNFDQVLQYALKHLETIRLFIGTHNEASNYLAISLMEQLGVVSSDPRVWFGQLYGMSDHISYNLAREGYNVAKYLPFGPVRDVLPYLIRRAEENTSVAGQTSRELRLLEAEKKRRKL